MLGPAAGGPIARPWPADLLAAQFGEALDPTENGHEAIGVDPRDVAGIVPAKPRSVRGEYNWPGCSGNR